MSSVDLDSLTTGQCRELLRSATIGRLVYTEHALPAIRPVRFVLADSGVLLRTTRYLALRKLAGTLVAFEADEIDPVTHMGWTVVVLGRAERVTDLESLVLVQEPEDPAEPGTECVRVRIDQVSGRRVALSSPLDPLG
jgi:nitroimidazol reductase NimA-like FMN-containing flavoprotein (pyridoxamine 5'-phosphate oxidase superfamily)